MVKTKMNKSKMVNNFEISDNLAQMFQPFEDFRKIENASSVLNKSNEDFRKIGNALSCQKLMRFHSVSKNLEKIGNTLSAQNKLNENFRKLRNALSVPNKLNEDFRKIGNALSAQNKLNENFSKLRNALSVPNKLNEDFRKIGNALSAQNKLNENFSKLRNALSVPNKLNEDFRKIGNALSAQNKLNENFRKMLQPSEDFKKVCCSATESLEKMKNSLSMPNIIDNDLYINPQLFQYNYPVKKNIKPEFSDNIEFVMTQMVDKVSSHIIKYIPNFVNQIDFALENLNSKHPEKLSIAMFILRRILEDLAKKIAPTNTSEKYYNILQNYIKEEYNMGEKHLKFIVDELNEGVHKPITQDQANKLFLHLLLFLDEIDWDGISKTNLN